MLIEGKKIAQDVIEKAKKEISGLKSKPKLSAVIVGDNPASKLYVKMKKKACIEARLECEIHEFNATTNEKSIISLIKKLNSDRSVSGIMVQIPLPDNLNTKTIVNSIHPDKDVDGLTEYGLGAVAMGEEEMAPCTPKGIVKLIESTGVGFKGKHIVIINHSNIIGKPLALMLLNRNATVTVCHEFTENLKEHTKKADILVTATGILDLIKKDMVKSGAVVIDGGVNKDSGKVRGDVDFEKVKDVAGFITPVPGGVGPMTIAMLIKNTLSASKKQ